MARKDRKKRDEQDVAVLDASASGAAEAPPEPVQSGRITATDIQQKEFRVAFRGYNERDVDVFLDQVTEEVGRLHADNKRLREEVEHRGGSSLVGADEADAIIRQARLEAERIMSDARTNAAAVAGSATPQAGLTPDEAATARVLIGAFLAREREFLQTIANLIQDHAQSVKDNAGRAREEIASVQSAPPAGSAPSVPVGQPPAAPIPPPGPPAEPPPVPPPAPARVPAPPPSQSGPPPPEPHPAHEPGPATAPPPPPARIPEAAPAVRAPIEEPTPAPVRPPSTLLDPAPDESRIAPASDPTTAEPLRRDTPPQQQQPGAERPLPPPSGLEPEDRSIQELFWGEV